MGCFRFVLYLSFAFLLSTVTHSFVPAEAYSTEASDPLSAEDSTELFSERRKSVAIQLRKVVSKSSTVTPSPSVSCPVLSVRAVFSHRLQSSHTGLGFPLLT